MTKDTSGGRMAVGYNEERCGLVTEGDEEPTIAEIFTLLEGRFPPPAGFKKSRTYGWEDCSEPIAMLQYVQIATAGDLNDLDAVDDDDGHYHHDEQGGPIPPPQPKGVGLKYWENQSGGAGWGWQLEFADGRELVDFLCIAYRGFSYDDHFDLVHEEDVEVGDDELQYIWYPNDEAEWLWGMRNSALEALAKGVSVQAATAAIVETFNGIVWGNVEWVGRWQDPGGHK